MKLFTSIALALMASALMSSVMGEQVPRRRGRIVRVLKSRRGRGSKFGARLAKEAVMQNQNIQIEEVPAGTFSLEEVRSIGSRYGPPQQNAVPVSSYGSPEQSPIQAPSNSYGAAAPAPQRAASSSYGSPQVEPEPIQAPSNSYGAAAPAPQRAASSSYGSPQVEPEPIQAPSRSYGAAAPAPQRAASSSYGSPQVEPEPIQAPSRSYGAAAPSPQRAASSSYGSPQLETEAIQAPSNSYGAAAPSPQRAASSSYGPPQIDSQIASPSTQSLSRQSLGEANPVAILRSVFNAPGSEGFERSYDFSFEADNGISQESSGELKTIEDTEVYVMRGSYSYIGADGADYVVTWVADENGYRADAKHLPIAVEIPFEDQRQAVAAQIRFAQEDKATEKSASQKSYQS